MHSSDHRMPASHCALKCISGKNIVRVRQILSHRKRTRFWACCPYSVRASLQSSSRGNLVLNGGSNATWSLRPKNTLRAGHFRLLAIVSYCRLHNASTFGSRLATRVDVKRPTMVASGEKTNVSSAVRDCGSFRFPCWENACRQLDTRLGTFRQKKCSSGRVAR